MNFDGYRAPSFMQVEGAKEVAIEFHSLSKTFNMTGWRIGFAVGNRDAIEGLGAIKSNIDSGVFQAVQLAGIEALKNYESLVRDIMPVYEKRRELMVKGLNEAGLKVAPSKATFYLWVSIPEGYNISGFRCKTSGTRRSCYSRQRVWRTGGGLHPHGPDSEARPS